MDRITITISQSTLATIGQGLVELPFKIANPAIMEINKQVAEFNKEQDRKLKEQKEQEQAAKDRPEIGKQESFRTPE